MILSTTADYHDEHEPEMSKVVVAITIEDIKNNKVMRAKVITICI